MSAQRATTHGPAGLSYGFPIGAVLGEQKVPGYRRRAAFGRLAPADDFDRLAELVLDWQVQRRSGVLVLDALGREARPVAEGLEVRLSVPVAGAGGAELRVTAPTRVIAVVREPDRVGFAYGTLDGHPERGEEAFLVRRLGASAFLELRVLSRPALPYALTGPVAGAMQKRFTDRYLAALAV